MTYIWTIYSIWFILSFLLNFGIFARFFFKHTDSEKKELAINFYLKKNGKNKKNIIRVIQNEENRVDWETSLFIHISNL